MDNLEDQGPPVRRGLQGPGAQLASQVTQETLVSRAYRAPLVYKGLLGL